MEYSTKLTRPEENYSGDPLPAGFIRRELERLSAALSQRQTTEQYCALYAAQQALCWALEPGGFAAPSEVVENGLVQPLRGTLEDSGDCSADRRRSPSSGTCSRIGLTATITQTLFPPAWT
jgi:hypothetical protein